MNIWNNIFQCHLNVTCSLLLHTPWMSSGISQYSMFGLLLLALHIGEQQPLPTVGYSGEGGSTLFPRPPTPQTASAKVLHHMAKFSFVFQDNENKITSAWPLKQCGSCFCQGELRSDKPITAHLVAELSCSVWSPTSPGQLGQRLHGWATSELLGALAQKTCDRWWIERVQSAAVLQIWKTAKLPFLLVGCDK